MECNALPAPFYTVRLNEYKAFRDGKARIPRGEFGMAISK